MENKKEIENPQAFPYIEATNGYGAVGTGEINGECLLGTPHSGMSLRDYFAGQALSSILGGLNESEVLLYDNIAEDCYKTADAMLKARSI